MPDVPFPRTVPDDAPTPPAPLLDQRAARAVFAVLRRTDGATGYRLAADAVYIDLFDGSRRVLPWVEVLEIARSIHGISEGRTDDDDPTRRERRQQRRQERRRQGFERGDDS